MREERERIGEWFGKEAPQLGELYQGALRLLDDATFPGRTFFICHAARDISNRVPEVIAGRAEFQKFQQTEELNRLAELWSRNELDRKELQQSTAKASVGAATTVHDVEIPIEVFRHLQILINHHIQVLENNLTKATKMIEAAARENAGRQESLVPLARHWVDLHGWFQRHTHAGVKEAAIDQQELQSKFQSLELYLYTLIGEFYGPVGGLDAILEDTNS